MISLVNIYLNTKIMKNVDMLFLYIYKTFIFSIDSTLN